MENMAQSNCLVDKEKSGVSVSYHGHIIFIVFLAYPVQKSSHSVESKKWPRWMCQKFVLTKIK